MQLQGPEAQQLATYIGWLMHRTAGGIAAGLLFVLPSLVLQILLSWLYLKMGQHAVVAGLFYGIEPAVTAIALNAAWRIGSRALNNGWMWAIAAASFIAIFTLHAPFPAIVATAALVGALGGRIAPGVFQTNGRHGAAARRHGTALIDDHTPTPPHASYSHARLARVLIAAVLLWLAPMALLVAWVAWVGWSGTFAQMGWFFTKAAMLPLAVPMRCCPMWCRARCCTMAG